MRTAIPTTPVQEQGGLTRAALEEAHFRTYQEAFRANEAEPNLANAAALVRAWNQFAATIGPNVRQIEVRP